MEAGTGTEPVNGKRIFPPLYQSTGEVALDRLAFFHILERLKVRSDVLRTEHNDTHPAQTQKRTGWVDHNV